MATSNAIAEKKSVPFSAYINSLSGQKLINNIIKDPARAKAFQTRITTVVANNPELQKCEAVSVLSGSLQGEALNLYPSPQMGQYYLVPFKKNSKVITPDGRTEWVQTVTAQFVLGYKGYVQLALRSGMYSDMNVMEVKAGEYLGRDSTTGKHRFKFIEDEDVRESTETIGYMASFEYMNGFKKSLYWSKEKMMNHASEYSMAFSKDKYNEYLAKKRAGASQKDLREYSSFWYRDFDVMAKKTMIRQLISQWGIMSAEIVTAFETDNREIFQSESGTLVAEPEPPMIQAEAVEVIPEPVPASAPAEPETVDLTSL